MFLTQFPSRTELQRSVNYGGADAKGEGVPEGTRLQFEEWHEKEEGFLLPKVWVRVKCVREPLREFLILWVVGSLLGLTQTVDMETTRKNKFGRILVAVLDPKLIPRVLDVVIGDHYFDLEFEVEKRGFDENGEEVDIEWDGGEGEGDGEGKQHGPTSENGLEDEQPRLEGSKRCDGNGGEDKRKDSRSKNDAPVNGHVLSKEEFEEFLSWKASKVIETAMDVVLEEAATKVAGEEDEPVDGTAENQGIGGVFSVVAMGGGEEMEVEGV